MYPNNEGYRSHVVYAIGFVRYKQIESLARIMPTWHIVDVSIGGDPIRQLNGRICIHLCREIHIHRENYERKEKKSSHWIQVCHFVQLDFLCIGMVPADMASSKEANINAAVSTLMADGQNYAAETGEARQLALSKFQHDLFSIKPSDSATIMERWQAKDPVTSSLVENVCGKLRVTDTPYDSNSDPQFLDLTSRFIGTTDLLGKTTSIQGVHKLLPELTAEAAESNNHLQLVSCFARADFEKVLRPLTEHKGLSKLFGSSINSGATTRELEHAEVFNFQTHTSLASSLHLVGDTALARSQFTEGFQKLEGQDREIYAKDPKVVKLARDLQVNLASIPAVDTSH
jgi:hypothetical protein